MARRHLLLLLIMGILLADACKKEFSYEGGFRKPAVFTLDGAPGGCMGATISGSYTVSIALTASNNVTISVNVISAGDYSLTASADGMTFSSSGLFDTTGQQVITLVATGTPSATGSINVPVDAGDSHCSFTVTVGDISSASSFTLNCGSVITGGTYTARIPLLSSNIVNISVNVATPGSYSISTTAINGITFSASGIFSVTGIHLVTLSGAGTPMASGTFSIPVNGGLSVCNFPLTVNPPPSGPGSNYWIFVENGITYQGFFTSVTLNAITLPPPEGPGSKLIATGQTFAGDSLFSFDLTDTAGVILNTELYNTSNAGVGNKASFSFTENGSGNIIYRAASTLPSVNILFKIVSYDAVNKTMNGTFSGTALNGTNVIKAIHNGVFYLSYP